MILSFSTSLILIAAFVIGLGMAGLAFLSLVINALTGRRKSNPPEKVGAWSGLPAALIVSAGLAGILIVMGGIYSVGSQNLPMARAVPVDVQQSSTRIKMDKLGNNMVALRKEPQPARPEIHLEPKLASGIEANDGAPDNVKDINVEPTNETAIVDARKVQLEEMVAGIGEFLRSQLEKVGDKSNATAFGQAAKSDNGDVVIFQPSDEMVQQMLGVGGQDLLKSFNSELPGRIRQTYALIPLTPPVGSTVPMKPMIATRGLEMIANSIVALVDHADSATLNATPGSVALTAEADGTLTVAPAIRPEPEWITQTDGRRIVARSKPVMSGDNAEILMTAAINDALAKHVAAVTASMDPAWQNQSRRVHMELPQSLAANYIVDRYERPETLETEVEGTKSFQVLYALVEFPDAIDQIAVRQIRYAIQKDRIIGLGVVVGLMWLSICSAGFGIRQWQKGTKLRKIAATPVFAVITIPTLLLTVAMVVALAKGNVPLGPWNENTVTIDLANI